MIPMPRNRSATQRLARQAGGVGRKNVPALYLKAFDIRDLSLDTVPGVIDPSFSGEWKAFITSNHQLTGDPAGRALRAVLSFLRYADSLKLQVGNPHFTFRDPISGANSVNPNKIRKTLLTYKLQSSLLMVQSLIRANRIPVYFKVKKTKVTSAIVRSQPKLIVSYVLGTANPRMQLDGVLSLLEGTLYQNTLPPQLASSKKKVGNKDKDQRPSYDSLLTGAGIIGWYTMERNADFSMYAVRAKDGYLVLKVILNLDPVSPDNGDLPITETVKIWSKFKLF